MLNLIDTSIYQYLLFKRGYLIADVKLECLEEPLAVDISANWQKTAVDSMTVYAAPDLNYIIQEREGTLLMLLGIAVNPLSAQYSCDEIVTCLLKHYLKSEDDFYDYLNALSGRFIILVASRKKKFIVQDAVGSKSVFYLRSTDQIMVSSHAQIIAELKNYSMGEKQRKFVHSSGYRSHYLKYFPGVVTPYTKIFLLIPNTSLNLTPLL